MQDFLRYQTGEREEKARHLIRGGVWSREKDRIRGKAQHFDVFQVHAPTKLSRIARDLGTPIEVEVSTDVIRISARGDYYRQEAGC